MSTVGSQKFQTLTEFKGTLGALLGVIQEIWRGRGGTVPLCPPCSAASVMSLALGPEYFEHAIRKWGSFWDPTGAAEWTLCHVEPVEVLI